MNSKEEILERVSDEMRDCFQFGNNLDLFDGQASTVFKAMDEYAKQECIAFGKFCVDNAWRIDKLVDTELTYTGLYQLYLQSKNNTP